MRRKIVFILSLILLIVAFGLYTFSEDNVLANLRLFTQVLSQVESKYVEEVDKAKLIAAATEGLMIPLDPFCQILASDNSGDFPSGNNGVYEKYGLAFTLDNGVPAVGAPIYGSPAYHQGIKAGDAIIRVNGKIYRNKSLSEVLEHMEIDPGDTLKLSIIPVDERGSIVYEFTEDAKYYTEEAVPAGILWEDYGYISLKRLSEGASVTFKDELTASNDKKALILDLRDCPNGSVQEAIAIADLFLPKGSIITQISSRNYDIIEKKMAQNSPIFSEKPLIILANQGTFGAAEIIASALSNHNIGVVIGERTAGKTGIQEVIPVSSQYAVELTTKEYLTPDEKSLLIEYEETEDGEKEVAKEPGLEPNLKVNEKNLERFVRTLIANHKIPEFAAGNASMILNKTKAEVLELFQYKLDEDEFDYNEDVFDESSDDVYYAIKIRALRELGKEEELQKYELENDPIYQKATELLAKASSTQELLELIDQEKETESTEE